MTSLHNYPLIPDRLPYDDGVPFELQMEMVEAVEQGQHIPDVLGRVPVEIQAQVGKPFLFVSDVHFVCFGHFVEHLSQSLVLKQYGFCHRGRLLLCLVFLLFP